MPNIVTDPPPSMAGTSGYKSVGPDAARLAHYRLLAADPARRRTRDRIPIPARTGRAFQLRKGEICRLSCNAGPQVADFIVFNADDRRERFGAARTRMVHGIHLGVGDQLWSAPPQSRPMLTIIADSVDHPPLPFGARAHDLLFCRCDSRHYELVHNRSGAPNCDSNLGEAIAAFGLSREHVHDPFNVFMTTGVNEQGRPFYLPSTAKPGDHVDFIAEMNCIIAVSACPGGCSGPESLPLEVELFTQI